MKNSYSNLIKLSSLLSDCQFHDGETLGNQLGITRAAIWKMTNKLVEYGVPIASIKGKGYAIEEPLILIDKKSIESKLNKNIAKQIELIVLETISSTATYLRTHYKADKHSICIAEHQSAGIGRLGRTWTSPFGVNIYFSSRFHFQCDIADLSGLSLVVSIALAKTLEQCSVKPQIKWPNDIVCDHQKLAGTLVELIAESNGNCHAIISVGINVNMLNHEDQIHQPWTSLRKLRGKTQDRNALCAALIQELIQTVETFRAQGLSHFKTLYQQYDALFNQHVVIKQFQSTFEGQAKGIDDFGRLLLETAPQNILPISAGDASIKKQ